MLSPEISVVMCVYDNADTLPAALESILSQEDVRLEFIVIDDGATDGSSVILDETAARDSRLKVVHKQNEGLTRGLIDACAMASAPWIARQDADDVSLPGRLRVQLERALQSDAPALVACGATYRSPDGYELFPVVPPVLPRELKSKVLGDGESPCPHGAALFSKAAYDAVGGYRPEFYYAQDLDLFTRLAESGPVASVPDILYLYTFSPFSISTYASGKQEAYRNLLRKGHSARMAGRSEASVLAEAESLCRAVRRPATRRPRPFAGLYFIGACLLQKNPAAAAAYFRQAVAARPWSVRAVVRLLIAEARSR